MKQASAEQRKGVRKITQPALISESTPITPGRTILPFEAQDRTIFNVNQKCIPKPHEQKEEDLFN